MSGGSTSIEEQNKFSKVIAGNPLSANPTKWSKTPKQFVDLLPTNCLSVFDHFAALIEH